MAVPQKGAYSEDAMTRLFSTAAVLALTAGSAFAQQDTITIGMQLEPPNLDPTGGAAAAIDEVTYANIFEGLTRFGPDGSVHNRASRLK